MIICDHTSGTLNTICFQFDRIMQACCFTLWKGGLGLEETESVKLVDWRSRQNGPRGGGGGGGGGKRG